MHREKAILEVSTPRTDYRIWLIAAAAVAAALLLWQARPAAPAPFVPPQSAPTTAPLATAGLPGRNPATAPATAPDGARPGTAPEASSGPIVIATPVPAATPARPVAPSSGPAGAHEGPAVINPGNPSSADDPPASQRAAGETAPPLKGDLGH
jgi:hypothetical protein